MQIDFQFIIYPTIIHIYLCLLYTVSYTVLSLKCPSSSDHIPAVLKCLDYERRLSRSIYFIWSAIFFLISWN